MTDIVERLRFVHLPLCVEAADKIERLMAWKAEAIAVLDRWEAVWVACGRPGELGQMRSDATRAEVERLTSIVDHYQRNALKHQINELHRTEDPC
jgi:hypothetical protein